MFALLHAMHGGLRMFIALKILDSRVEILSLGDGTKRWWCNLLCSAHPTISWNIWYVAAILVPYNDTSHEATRLRWQKSDRVYGFFFCFASKSASPTSRQWFFYHCFLSTRIAFATLLYEKRPSAPPKLKVEHLHQRCLPVTQCSHRASSTWHFFVRTEHPAQQHAIWRRPFNVPTNIPGFHAALYTTNQCLCHVEPLNTPTSQTFSLLSSAKVLQLRPRLAHGNLQT